MQGLNYPRSPIRKQKLSRSHDLLKVTELIGGRNQDLNPCLCTENPFLSTTLCPLAPTHFKIPPTSCVV